MGRSAVDDTKPLVTWDMSGELRISDADGVRAVVESCLYAEDSLYNFCNYFLNWTPGKKKKSTFSGAWTWQRKEFARTISDPRIPKVAGEAYRGFAKSTLLKAEIIRGLCFRLYPFVLYTSAELDLAERATDSIRFQLIHNPIIKLYFGDLKPAYMDGAKETFGTKAFKLTDPITNMSYAVVVPKSENTTCNGLIDTVEGREQRPVFMANDDGEDRKKCDSAEYRANHIEWFVGTWLPCVDTDYQPNPETNRWDDMSRGDSPPWLVRAVDTPKHGDALIEHLMALSDWVGLKYPIAEEVDKVVFRSLVEGKSDAMVQAIYDQFRSIFREDRFYMEYMCTAQAPTDYAFPSNFEAIRFREWDYSVGDDANEGAINLNRGNVIRAIIMDPARTKNARSAATAMLAIAIDVDRATIYLRRLVNEHLSIDEIEDRLFRLCWAMNTDIVAAEDQGLNDWLRNMLMTGAAKRGMNIHFCWLKASVTSQGNRADFGEGQDAVKRWRAATALPYYTPFPPSHPHGHILHEVSLRNSALEIEERNYPRCRKWDAMDCLGYIQQLMGPDHLNLRFAIQDMGTESVFGAFGHSDYEEAMAILAQGSYRYAS